MALPLTEMEKVEEGQGGQVELPAVCYQASHLTSLNPKFPLCIW